MNDFQKSNRSRARDFEPWSVGFKVESCMQHAGMYCACAKCVSVLRKFRQL